MATIIAAVGPFLPPHTPASGGSDTWAPFLLLSLMAISVGYAVWRYWRNDGNEGGGGWGTGPTGPRGDAPSGPRSGPGGVPPASKSYLDQIFTAREASEVNHSTSANGVGDPEPEPLNVRSAGSRRRTGASTRCSSGGR